MYCTLRVRNLAWKSWVMWDRAEVFWSSKQSLVSQRHKKTKICFYLYSVSIMDLACCSHSETRDNGVAVFACSVGFYCKESWVPKNWCFWTVVLEKALESPLDCKEIQPVHPKGNQTWIYIGRTDAEAETPILWPPDMKKWLTGKDPDAGKDWKGEKKRGWDGWMASPTQSTWVWVNSGSWWWTGKPGMLQSMGLQRVRHYWATELTELIPEKTEKL